MDDHLDPDMLLTAYANGIFPMADDDGEVVWLAPDPRAIIPLGGLKVSRSLRAACRRGRYEVLVDRDVPAVIAACADRPDGTWISEEIEYAYLQLFELGFVHSVECRQDGRLVGGLYGVSIGGAFFGESMFHRATDASKVALVHLVERMKARGLTLLDIQFMTDHLESLGAVAIPRREYLARLRMAIALPVSFADPPPSPFAISFAPFDERSG